MIRSFKLFLGKLFGFNIPVRIIRTRGKSQIVLNDVARLKKVKDATTRMFELFIENRKLPTPPHDAYLGDVVQIASSEKGKYKYVTFDVDANTITGIDQDMRFWEENEIMYERNRIKEEDGFLKKHGVTIMIGIVCLISVISLVVWVQQIVIPLSEKAASIGAANITCNWTGLPIPNSPVTPPV